MTTYIESFDRLCLGKNAPAILDVERDAVDETIIASFHNFTSLSNVSDAENTRAEFRKKDNEFALFLFQYPDSEVPEWWKDSEIIWSTEQENKFKERERKWDKLFEIIDSGDITSDDITETLIKLDKKHLKSK